MMHRGNSYRPHTPATCTVSVCARQTGKTFGGAHETLRVMTERPGSFSVLLAPTYQISRAAVRNVIQAADSFGLPYEWKEQKKEFRLPNGSVLAVFSADRKESVRGPTINGIMWLDEAAYLDAKAWEAALGALAAVQHPQILITTTPAGQNWVYGEFQNRSENRVLQFKSSESPYSNKALVAKLRRKMSKEKAAQEFDAVFVGSLLLAFPDRGTLWVDSHPARDKPTTLDNVLGVDLGKEQDFVVITLMNKFGEGIPLARWRRVDWPTSIQRIADYCRRFDAIPVLDHGHGGGYGGVAQDYLKAQWGIESLMVKTGSVGTKGTIIEAARADVQWGRVTLSKTMTPTDAPNDWDADEAPLWEVYDHEMARFQMLKKVVRGEEITVFEGPQGADDHDDCPISFALANWGRLHAWEDKHRDEAVDLGAFVRASRKATGYRYNPWRGR